MGVSDGRRAPFAWQSCKALRLIAESFESGQRSTALAFYTALSLGASEARDGGHDGGFVKPRKSLAEFVGTTPRTLDRYVDRFVVLGLLRVDHRGADGVSLPNRWVLLDTCVGDGGSDTGVARGSDTGVAQREEPTSKGSAETRAETEKNARAARDATPPEGFPDDLRPHARIVFPALREVAAERGASAVTPRAIGRALMDYPRKPLVATALELRAWALEGNGRNKPVRDVVGRYRRWLRNENDLETLERLGPDGIPSATPARVARVHPIRSASGVRLSAGERLEERTAIRRAEFERLGGKL